MELFNHSLCTNSKIIITLTVHLDIPNIIVDGLSTLPNSSIFC